MPGPERALWGAVGASVTFLVMYVLPELERARRADRLHLNRMNVVALALLWLSFGAIGAAFGVALSEGASPRNPLFVGVTWLSIWRGGMAALRDARQSA